MQDNKTENGINENEVNDSIENQELPAEETQETVLDPIQKIEAELAEMKDKYIRLYSEFENFRRRTSKEKMELVKTAGEDIMISVLPILDDFERALKAIGNDDSTKAIREGIELIYHKTVKTLQSKGLVKMESIGKPFDSDLHEAITQIPVTDAQQKGKVVDEVEAGYFLGEKVIRFAKVVIGA
ncbi:MAG TPA: nucleotide exchange factor GrpE [Cytophagaceae bacterium]|jgi:molecular chaperone GrpE|nr:nucleotide exchange factor GrpE [Cytophagaceae bacterium]